MTYISPAPALNLRVQQSFSAIVEEDAIIKFSISLTDVETGAIASDDIDITGITATLKKSTGPGGALSVSGITQPTFVKGAGLVSVDYRFLAAEWAEGDMYELRASGIDVTIDEDTGYVKECVWSNIVLSQGDASTAIAALQADVGDPSARTNLQSIETMLGNPDTAGKTIYEAMRNLRETAINGSSLPISNTLSDILHKDGVYTYDNTTDSLEALSDKVTTIDAVADGIQSDLDNATDGLGTLKALIDAVDTKVTTVDTVVDGIQTDLDNGTDGLGALKTLIDTVDTVADGIQTDLDNGTDGLGALKILIDAVDTKVTTVDTVVDGIQTDLDNGTDGLGAIATKVDTVDTVADGIQTDLSNATDGLGALKTLIDTVDTVADGIQTDLDNGTDGLGALKTLIDTVDTVVDNIEDLVDGTSATPVALRREHGKTQIAEFSITAAANAGVTTIATITSQPCLIKSITLHADTAQTGDLTSAAIKGGASQVIEFISAATAAQANLDAIDKQVDFTGAKRLAATKTLAIDLQGTGAIDVDLTVTVEYEACVDGGYLA